MGLIVCGANLSPFVRKIRVQLMEKGVPFTLEQLNPFQAGEEFTEQNPLRRIPILKDTDIGPDFVLPDSSVIAQYIEKKYPTPAMLPDDSADYGRALWFEEYADTELALKVGLGVFRPMVFPQMAGSEANTEDALIGAKKLAPVFDYLDGAIAGKTWFAGNKFGLADISVATHFMNLRFTGVAVCADRWPNLAAFIDRAFARETFAAVNAEHDKMIAGLKKLDVDAKELWP